MPGQACQQPVRQKDLTLGSFSKQIATNNPKAVICQQGRHARSADCIVNGQHWRLEWLRAP